MRSLTEDVFVEVNHGPFLVDNNLFLSAVSLQDWSQVGGYVHNLCAGRIKNWAEHKRFTPFPPAHSTTVAGLTNIQGGDDRFFNNEAKTALVTTGLLGLARIPQLPYQDVDGSELKIKTDYFGKQRNGKNPTPGPFESPSGGSFDVIVWKPLNAGP